MMIARAYFLAALAVVFRGFAEGLTFARVSEAAEPASFSRRSLLASIAATAATTVQPSVANARYVLNEDTGDYDEVDDSDWQTAWKERLDKANSMSTDEVFAAARGAGNTELKDGPESESSKKRRAMSGCRDSGLRAKAGTPDVKECTARVLRGDVDFILESM
uniref:Uncharacterized protein n=2 Tax=Trieres chinensis TaxID=1514140 RepID=A0A7S1ZTT4_TRICV|mmetsp:Transcript_33069/g.67494  ORF Transcript_33069/g.67494 Transcript_33069/m.67494 type:complete len:163 (+) Transcript_33069:32-520(+)